MGEKVELSHEWAAERWDWPLQQDEMVRVMNTKDGFEVGLDARSFKPNEIEVKAVGHELWIHCHHDERQDTHGRISRELHRSYRLPEDVDKTSLKATLRNDGVLIIKGQKIASG